MFKIYTPFQTKTAQKPYSSGWHIPIYTDSSLYREYLPGVENHVHNHCFITMRFTYQYCGEPLQCDPRSLAQLLIDCTVIPVKTAPTKTEHNISSITCLLISTLVHQGPVVQRVDNAIHRINHYPVRYPVDSDLSTL